jgi:hypothetical protein
MPSTDLRLHDATHERTHERHGLRYVVAIADGQVITGGDPAMLWTAIEVLVEHYINTQPRDRRWVTAQHALAQLRHGEAVTPVRCGPAEVLGLVKDHLGPQAHHLITGRLNDLLAGRHQPPVR